MSDLLLVFVWTITTLGMATISIALGKRYSVAYPIAMMATLVTVAQILSNKMVVIGPFVVAGGILVYSATFLITDLISELWGKEQAKMAVWAGFLGAFFLMVTLWFTVLWPAPIFAQEAAANFASALSLTPRIIFGSLIAYVLVQNLDVWLYHFWKDYTKGKHLWLRNNASTLVSQLFDTIIFATIAFYGVVPLLPIIVGGYIVKVAVALIDTPFAYALCHITRKIRPASDTL